MKNYPAVRILRGEPAAKVAREVGVHTNTMIRQVGKWLSKQSWYSVDEHMEHLRKPGSGWVKSGRALFKAHMSD